MNRSQNRKNIDPAKCFFKTNRMGVPYKYCLNNDKDYAKYNRLTLKKNEERLVKAEKVLDKQEDTIADLKAEIRKNKSKLAQDKRNKDNKKEEDKKITKNLGKEILGNIRKKVKSKTEIKPIEMNLKSAREEDTKIRKKITKLRQSLKEDINKEEENKIKKEIKSLKKIQKTLEEFLDN